MNEHVRAEAGRRGGSWPERLAWLPIALFLVAGLSIHSLRITAIYESAVLVATLNTLFCTAVSFLVAYLSARSYLRGGSSSVLFLGCGALVFAMTYMLSGLTIGRLGVAVAVHNIGVFLTGACFLLSAGFALVHTREDAPTPSASRQIALAYLGALVLVGLVFWGAYTEAIPDFFILGQGTTVLRQVVLAATVVELLAAALCFGIHYRRSPSAFLLWYSLGLAFVAFGVGTVALASSPGTPLSWLGRSGQYLGGLYMLFAILGQARDSWRIPLERALHESELRFRLDFYRRTILAATGGKLVITEIEEIDRIAGPSAARWDLTAAAQLRAIRAEIKRMAESAGMDEVRVQRLLTCVGEATSNAIKHANGGTVTLHQSDARLLVRIDDEGTGIDALDLPDVALTLGYTTAGTGGLGYKMMIAAADRLYLATGTEGTTVAAELMIHEDAETPLVPTWP